MEARAKLLGHSVHQMLVALPIGLFTTAALVDLVGLFVHVPELPAVSFWNLMIGTVGGLAAAVFGAIDLGAVPFGSRASRIGLVHACVNVLAVTLFAFAALVRSQDRSVAVTPFVLALEVTALASMLVGGWMGGELVDRLGIGVDEGAHPNASSSLTRRPISEDHPGEPVIAHPEHVGIAAPDTDPARSRPQR
jgi:uncharacterized membrane protein